MTFDPTNTRYHSTGAFHARQINGTFEIFHIGKNQWVPVTNPDLYRSIVQDGFGGLPDPKLPRNNNVSIRALTTPLRGYMSLSSLLKAIPK
jgi:hypothetical protein